MRHAHALQDLEDEVAKKSIEMGDFAKNFKASALCPRSLRKLKLDHGDAYLGRLQRFKADLTKPATDLAAILTKVNHMQRVNVGAQEPSSGTKRRKLAAAGA